MNVAQSAHVVAGTVRACEIIELQVDLLQLSQANRRRQIACAHEPVMLGTCVGLVNGSHVPPSLLPWRSSSITCPSFVRTPYHSGTHDDERASSLSHLSLRVHESPFVAVNSSINDLSSS